MSNTREYLQELQALEGETSGEKRRELLHRVTDLFFATQQSQDVPATAVFGDVMERVAYELEIEARTLFARRMSVAERAPHGLMLRLAKDHISVARPVLERSLVLTDDDLIHIVRQESQDHMQAIAARARLARPITTALVQKGNERVISRVTANPGAEFSQDSLAQIAEQARFSQDILDALASRRDLPPDLMAEVKRNVATRLKTEFRSGMPPGAAGQELDALIEQTAGSLDLSKLQAADAELVEQHSRKPLSEQHLVRLAREGNRAGVVRCLALMTGLDDPSVSFCMTRAEISSLGIICKAQGFANSTYLALLDIRLANIQNSAIVSARAVRQYNDLSRTAAERAMRFLKVRKSVSTKTPH
ncbi:MAG: DUF2336 domain-containing protein [Pseudomonadota bacterium]|nr:DUF2336 domain-containing protein [Pseudomonadota bacterium]